MIIHKICSSQNSWARRQFNIFEVKVFENIPTKAELINNRKNFLVGIRPEQIKIAEKDKGLFNAKVKMTSSLGSEKVIHLFTANSKFIAKVSTDLNISEGKDVGISFEKDKVFFFEKESSKRIST